MKKNIQVSVVIPSFNEAASLPELVDRIVRTMNKSFRNNFENIFNSFVLVGARDF